MNKEEIKKWLNENENNLIRYIALDEWRIDTVILESEEKNEDYGTVTSGRCHAQFEYREATISLFAKNISDLRELQEVYVHELCHIATASFKFYHNYLFDSKTVNEWDRKNLAPIYKTVSELLAVQMQRAISGFFYGSRYSKKIDKKDLESNLEDLCYAHEKMKEHKPRILLNDKRTKISEEEILWNKKKDDSNFWYENWKKSLDLTRPQKNPEKLEKKILLLNEPQNKNAQDIILPDDFEEEDDDE